MPAFVWVCFPAKLRLLFANLMESMTALIESLLSFELFVVGGLSQLDIKKSSVVEIKAIFKPLI